jgi:hypothetical protein
VEYFLSHDTTSSHKGNFHTGPPKKLDAIEDNFYSSGTFTDKEVDDDNGRFINERSAGGLAEFHANSDPSIECLGREKRRSIGKEGKCAYPVYIDYGVCGLEAESGCADVLRRAVQG